MSLDPVDVDVEHLDVCRWCDDSTILLFDYDEFSTVGDDCPACKTKTHELTLEEFEDQLRDQGYTEEEIAIELEKIESDNENLGGVNL